MNWKKINLAGSSRFDGDAALNAYRWTARKYTTSYHDLLFLTELEGIRKHIKNLEFPFVHKLKKTGRTSGRIGKALIERTRNQSAEEEGNRIERLIACKGGALNLFQFFVISIILLLCLILFIDDVVIDVFFLFLGDDVLLFHFLF